MMEIFSDVPLAAASAAETELLKGGKARVETSLECGLPFFQPWMLKVDYSAKHLLLLIEFHYLKAVF